tara:strand:- start:560 stop:724 length:165 start_codon:yes stop_codon:yes gene_type:complete
MLIILGFSERIDEKGELMIELLLDFGTKRDLYLIEDSFGPRKILGLRGLIKLFL